VEPATLAGFAGPGPPEREPLAGPLLVLAAVLVPVELALRRLGRTRA
ncbi:hypothetical protein HY251_09725, partial [bacterium]|nr:hypothetical protein [bacterium]